MYSKSYYEKLEQELYEILQLIGSDLTGHEISEISKMIENREYGIAIQDLGYILITSNLTISKEAALLIDRVIEKMGIKVEDDDGDYCFWLEIEPYLKSFM